MTDPRVPLQAAEDWVADLIEGVGPDQFDDPTPASAWNVRELIRHIHGVAGMSTALAQGSDPLVFADTEEAADSDWPTLYRATLARTRAAWPPDADLSATVVIPRGETTVDDALTGWLVEFVAHGWDLAVATGQPSEADSALAERALAIAQQLVPAEIREIPTVPFEAVIESAADAGPTERLANFLGWRSRVV